MTFSFSTTEPAANSAPSVSQGIMQTNNVSSNAILAVDHYSYNNTLGGQHNQVTIPAFTSPSPSAPSSTGSVLYTVAGSANSSTANLIFQNSGCSCLISPIRAFGYFQATAGIPSMLNSYNFASATYSTASGLNIYAITLTANVVANTNALIFVNSTFTETNNASAFNAIAKSSWLSTGVLEIRVQQATTTPNFISWMVLQA